MLAGANIIYLRTGGSLEKNINYTELRLRIYTLVFSS